MSIKGWTSFLGLAWGVALALGMAAPIEAQDVTTAIVRDGSIGPDATVQPVAAPLPPGGVFPEDRQRLAGLDPFDRNAPLAPTPEGGVLYEIPEALGVRSRDGATLFHSFARFDLGAPDTVFFTSTPGVGLQSVVVRVTGGEPSRILGQLSTGTFAEFYFLNPSGVQFGRGGTLLAGSSFIASTADALVFADGSRFEAKLGSDPPLLGSRDVAALEFGRPTGSITADGANLVVREGTLGLVTASSGARVGIVSGADRVMAIDDDSPEERFLTPRSIVELTWLSPGVGGGEAGRLLVRDSFVRVSMGASFFPVDATALLAAESIELANATLAFDSAERIQLLSAGSAAIRDSLFSFGSGAGFAGEVEQILIAGSTVDVLRSSLSARTRISIAAEGLLQIGKSSLSSRIVGIQLTSGVRLSIDNSMISAVPDMWDTAGVDTAISFSLGGRLQLDAPTVDIGSRSRLSTSAANASTGEIGLAGAIEITGDRVRIAGGSQLLSQVPVDAKIIPSAESERRDFFDRRRPTAVPRAGSISILAGDIEILEGSGISSAASFSPMGPNSSVQLGGMFEIEPFVLGSAGVIRLEASRSLVVSDSKLDSGVRGQLESDRPLVGDAGSIALLSSGPLLLERSSVTSSASGNGAAGSLLVAGGDVAVKESLLLSSNTGSGPAGSVSIDAGGLTISGASRVATEARRGPNPGLPADGNIDVAVEGDLLLGQGSIFSASVVEGQGGDVRIASQGSVVLLDGSALLANTADGTGGRIDITTRAFLSDSTSRVSADAGVGSSGDVQIRSPEVDLQKSIGAPSPDFLNVSALLRPSCDIRAAEKRADSFFVAANGLPASPEEFLLAFDASDVLPVLSTNAGSAPAWALLTLARRQQAQGAYADSLITLQDALMHAQRAPDRTDIAAVLGASGNAQLALGRSDAAEALLMRGGSLAREEGAQELASRIKNDLGNYYAVTGALDRARASYAEAIELAEMSGNTLDVARALANAARAAIEAGDDTAASTLLTRADAHLDALPEGQPKAAILIHLGYSHARGAGNTSLLRAHALLRAAADLSRGIGDDRLQSYALGNLGGLYQRENRLGEALVLTRQALRSAERAQAPDATYRWNRQEGGLLWMQGKAHPAVQSYRRAVEILEESRQESRARYGFQDATFRRALAPVYLDFADVLLRGADLVDDRRAAEALLLEARATVEKLKAAELRNYLRDDCSAQLETRTASVDSLVDSAAVVYPIALRDRLELLVRLPEGLERYTVPVTSAQIDEMARRFRRELLDRTSNGYQASAYRLYDWLIRPYAHRLAAQKARTLVFVPDGALRAIPISALHDGQQFLAERFSLATAPGLSLVDAKPFDRTRVKPLIGGISEQIGEFPALSGVPRELNKIRELFGGNVLLDSAFKVRRIEDAIVESRPTLMHLASHAVFTGDPGTSFLLTHDGRMSMLELGEMIRRTRFRSDPVELLVLSACETALGDDRAALGLSGVAIRSGARSALGSLWAISDEATYALIVEFYTRLAAPGASRAEALQHAQRSLIASEEFSHPFYWSAFVLLSNWL